MADHLYSGPGAKVRWFVKRFGACELFLLPLRILCSRLVTPFLRARRFPFRDENLEYFYAHYNVTWCNERCVEVPIGRQFLARAKDGDVLEVGHVLGHYGDRGHAVLDKFETAEGIINADITEWDTEQRFDLILSISTFEHIGFDDDAEEGSDEKILAAIAACRALLKPGGVLAYTVPLGYNPDLDQLIEADAMGQDRGWFLLRRGPRDWAVVKRAEALGTEYGRPFPFANALFIAEHDK